MVMNRKDQRLISPARLAGLEEQAQDGKDMRAAIASLSAKHYQKMEVVRLGPGVDDSAYDQARGWLEHESDLSEAILRAQEARGEEVGF